MNTNFATLLLDMISTIHTKAFVLNQFDPIWIHPRETEMGKVTQRAQAVFVVQYHGHSFSITITEKDPADG